MTRMLSDSPGSSITNEGNCLSILPYKVSLFSCLFVCFKNKDNVISSEMDEKTQQQKY